MYGFNRPTKRVRGPCEKRGQAAGVGGVRVLMVSGPCVEGGMSVLWASPHLDDVYYPLSGPLPHAGHKYPMRGTSRQDAIVSRWAADCHKSQIKNIIYSIYSKQW
jgi:hypothetical protein